MLEGVAVYGVCIGKFVVRYCFLFGRFRGFGCRDDRGCLSGGVSV